MWCVFVWQCKVVWCSDYRDDGKQHNLGCRRRRAECCRREDWLERRTRWENATYDVRQMCAFIVVEMGVARHWRYVGSIRSNLRRFGSKMATRTTKEQDARLVAGQLALGLATATSMFPQIYPSTLDGSDFQRGMMCLQCHVKCKF